MLSQVLPLRSFKRSEKGATAVEFALISPALVFICMAIFEVSLMFFAAVNIDGAAIDAARRIRTGQTQATADPEADFANTLCDSLDIMIDCGTLHYDARTMSTYGSITLDTEYDPITGEPITYGFTTGGSGDIVVVRVMYSWTINTPLIGRFFETSSGSNKRLLASTVVFQSEPYE